MAGHSESTATASELIKQLQQENTELQSSLQEAQETLRAIESGGVDSLIVTVNGQKLVYALQGTNYAYRVMVEEMSEGAATMAADGTILYANRRLAELLKTSLENVIGTSLEGWLEPADQKTLPNLLETTASQSVRMETNLVDAVKCPLPVQLSVNSINLGESQDIFCLVITDLTEQRRNAETAMAEEIARRELAQSKRTQSALLSVLEDERIARASLAASEAELRALFASMRDVVLVVDREGVVRRVASSDSAVLPIRHDELLGMSLDNLLTHTQAESCLHAIRESLDTQQTTQFEYVQTVQGQSVWFSAIITAMTDAEVVWVARDITEKKKLAIQREQWVAQVERSNRELEQFAYVASHDLQEPLRMVTSYLDLIQRRYESSLDQDAKEFIAFAVEGAGRMQTLIRDLLAFSRIETRGQSFKPVDCEIVLKTTLQNLTLAVAEGQATVTHDSLPMVMGDEIQLVQLLQNLIGNAIKFRGDDAPLIHIGAESLGDQFRLFVRDNGIGIDPQYHQRIFDIFQHLHSRDEYAGTGIGLAICKRIVERHGGSIWLESELNQGATFYFTLPSAN